METTRYELADSFIKYITGVYVLQQDFIDDMRGGLQAILEKYNVTLVGSNTEESNATQEAVNEPQTTAKKTRKKNTKKEASVIEEQTINDVVEEQLEGGEGVEGVEGLQQAEQAEEVEKVEHLEQDVAIPQHVEDIVNIPVEKKKRKPRAKKEEMKISEPVEPVENVEAVEPVEAVESVEPVEPVELETKNKVKNKRATSPYELFKKEFSQSPEMKGKKMSEITPLAKEQWNNIVKNDPETENLYKEKAELLNKSK
jgi:hypothetical protein